MSQAEKASEPSMEEILASIRKIIAEEPIGSRPQIGDGRANPPPPMRAELPAPSAKVPLPPPTKSAQAAPRSQSPAASAARVDDMLDMIDDGLSDRGARAKASADGANDGVPSWLFPKPPFGDAAPGSEGPRPMPELKVPMDNRPYFQQPPPGSNPPAPTAYASGAAGATSNSIRREQNGADLGTFVPSRNEQMPTHASMPLSRDPIPTAPERRMPAAPEVGQLQVELGGLRAPQRVDDGAPERTTASPVPVNGSAVSVRSAPQAQVVQPALTAPQAVIAPQGPQPPNPVAAQVKAPEPDAVAKQPPAAVPTAAAAPVKPPLSPPAASQPAAPKPIADVANPTMRVSQPIDMPRTTAPKSAPSVTASVNIPKPPEASVVVTGTAAATASAPTITPSMASASVPSLPPRQLATQELLGPVRTMEDTVAELLRPMLRQWLDQNMPRIVEKALRVKLAESAKKRPPNS